MLIPSFGAIGAALALVLTAFFSAIVSGVLVYIRLGALIESSTFFRGALATVLMALVCLQIPWTGPWLLLKYAFLVVLYALTLLVMGELKWDDLKLLGWPARREGKSRGFRQVKVFAKPSTTDSMLKDESERLLFIYASLKEEIKDQRLALANLPHIFTRAMGGLSRVGYQHGWATSLRMLYWGVRDLLVKNTRLLLPH